ncbi:uncharacterized protein LOC135812169 [Sycon ciliatum]|uniref:uncharacterized protein LOC135812169 n=1 Tax=Sycon ciliatum TaxID=27933 RepID=UPI0031F705F4
MAYQTHKPPISHDSCSCRTCIGDFTTEYYFLKPVSIASPSTADYIVRISGSGSGEELYSQTDPVDPLLNGIYGVHTCSHNTTCNYAPTEPERITFQKVTPEIQSTELAKVNKLATAVPYPVFSGSTFEKTGPVTTATWEWSVEVKSIPSVISPVEALFNPGSYFTRKYTSGQVFRLHSSVDDTIVLAVSTDATPNGYKLSMLPLATAETASNVCEYELAPVPNENLRRPILMSSI